MADFVPRDELGRIEWMLHLAGWLEAEGVGHGFTLAEIVAFRAAAVAAEAGYARSEELQTAARAGTVAKKQAVGTALKVAREFARRIQSVPNTTDAHRAAAGITVPDRRPTPVSPDAIQGIEPPSIYADFGIRHQVALHCGPNPHNEKYNGRPAGARAIRIEMARGGIPDKEDGWRFLEQVTRSPYIHHVHEDTPATYAYRACYVDTKLRRGPFGDPVTCTVSV